MDKNNNRGYLGNKRLKSSGSEISWTEDLVEEWIKCENDPIYWAEKYIKIVHVDRGLIPIELYDYQKEIIRDIHNNRYITVNTARQAGKTTTAVVILLHFALFNDHKVIGLTANVGRQAREILSRIKTAFEGLPLWMQQGVIEWNKGSVEFENGSKIFAGTTTSAALRGSTLAFLYIDETAFVENYDEFFASVYPTISSGKTTKLMFTSTPNGLNHFYKTCINAKLKKNGFIYHEVPWHRVPGRDDQWKQETIAALDGDIDKFNVEFNCEFQGSSSTLISGSRLKELAAIPPSFEFLDTKMYDQPEEDHAYVLVADVCRGVGLDYSAFSVIDVTKMPYKQVAVYRDNLVTPYDFAEIIHVIAKRYNDAWILVESNDLGSQVLDELHFDLEAENMIYTQNAGAAGKRISLGFGNKQKERGVRTTKSVKAVGCNVLKLLIEKSQLIIDDENTIDELTTFVRSKNSYAAESGKHDDLVMTLVLFSWMSDQEFFKELTDIHTVKSLRNNDQSEEAENMMEMFYDDGMDEYEEEFFI